MKIIRWNVGHFYKIFKSSVVHVTHQGKKVMKQSRIKFAQWGVFKKIIHIQTVKGISILNVYLYHLSCYKTGSSQDLWQHRIC